MLKVKILKNVNITIPLPQKSPPPLPAASAPPLPPTARRLLAGEPRVWRAEEWVQDALGAALRVLW